MVTENKTSKAVQSTTSQETQKTRDFQHSLEYLTRGFSNIKGFPPNIDIGLMPQIVNSTHKASWDKAIASVEADACFHRPRSDEQRDIITCNRAEKETITSIKARIRKVEWFIKQRGMRYYNCSFSTYETSSQDQAKVLSKVKDIASKLGTETELQKNLFLFGPAGTGKDHLLTSLITTAIWEHNHYVTWINGNHYFSQMKDAIGKDTMESWLAPLRDVPILAISDPLPLRGVLSDFIASHLSDVIDERYNNLLPTWLTVNVVNREEADKRIGIRTVDRLVHGGNFIRCSWESYRGKQVTK